MLASNSRTKENRNRPAFLLSTEERECAGGGAGGRGVAGVGVVEGQPWGRGGAGGRSGQQEYPEFPKEDLCFLSNGSVRVETEEHSE